LLLDCLLFGPHVPAHCDFGAQSWDIGKPPQKGLFIPVMFYQLSPSVCHYHLPPTTSPSPCPAHALLRRPHVCHREPSCSSRRHASRCVGCVWGVWGVCGVWRCACMFVWRYLCFVCLPACARACVPLHHQDDMVFALRPLPSAKEETKRNPKSACPFPPPPSSCLFSRLEPPLLALVGTLPVVPHTIL
jgi:hypothetical protein